ncbi:hypothetical protein OG874_26360 [Nocardia sp. NBC_00565]|uniref:hypothetical protein n=1 Tax=Nocardia sp. NBC_00565 TaxID=2975993 RepID=UPI002E81504A|nr:hypothetical protein [Nocardia sp. NBC_00565]WUC00407.1 hypothetical protein OG874_26360 [Nocardia sp. NBC_00565]
MREIVVGYFRHHGISTLYVGEPQLLMGHFGLYEVRIEFEFDVDGAVSRTGFGLIDGAFAMIP